MCFLSHIYVNLLVQDGLKNDYFNSATGWGRGGFLKMDREQRYYLLLAESVGLLFSV